MWKWINSAPFCAVVSAIAFDKHAYGLAVLGVIGAVYYMCCDLIDYARSKE